jgi:hypothetical protein
VKAGREGEDIMDLGEALREVGGRDGGREDRKGRRDGGREHREGRRGSEVNERAGSLGFICTIHVQRMHR